ncbi:MAG: HNH endonuclease [Gammaproteobacteria bacterium]|nr:HNH endonuclease [Gammaproteobacteria bacterium]
MSAKLVESLSDDRMVITDAGRALLNLLEIYEPDVAIFDYDELEKKTSEELRKIKESHGSHRPIGIDKPEKVKQIVVRYARSPQVQAYVLNRAGNACELCSNQAPFVKEDGTPFLEIHHIVQLSQGGPDTSENTVALCPNCHRHLHYGKDQKKKEQELRKNIKNH